MGDALRRSDGVLALIGPDWVGVSADGTLRIDQEDDVVRQEVRHALDDQSKPTPLPVLVDMTARELTDMLPTDAWAALLKSHVLESTRDDLLDPSGVDYQRLLVGMWHSLTTQLQNAVLIIGEYATAELENFIETMKKSKAVEARDLSRVGANAYALPVRKLRKKAKRWPDVIVLVDSKEENRRRSSLMTALDEHPHIKTVSVVGLGAAVGAGATVLATGGIGSSSSTTVTAHAGAAQFASSVPGSGGLGLIGGTVGVGLKVAAAGAVAVAAVTTAVAVLPDDRNFDFNGQNLAVAIDDERAFPLGRPEQVEVTLGPEQETDEVGAIGNAADGYVRRSVIVKLPGEVPIDFGQIVVPTGFSESGAELNSDGTFTVASASVAADLSYSELRPGNFCFEVNNSSRVVGGWDFTGAPGTVEVLLMATIENGEVSDTSTEVIVTAPARRVLLEELDENLDLSNCPELNDGVIRWGGTET